MGQRTIVHVGAHPDDIFAAAGTLLLLRRAGYALVDLCLTRGEGWKPPHPVPDVAAARVQEEQAACDILGAELHVLGLPDSDLYADREACGMLAERLRALAPAAVITHWALDKPDHAAAFGIVHKALYLADLYWTTELYLTQAEVNGYVFHPDLYVNISSVIDTVREVGRCYALHATWVETILGCKQTYGRLSWCDHAEAFKTALPLMGTRWNRRAEVGGILLAL